MSVGRASVYECLRVFTAEGLYNSPPQLTALIRTSKRAAEMNELAVSAKKAPEMVKTVEKYWKWPGPEKPLQVWICCCIVNNPNYDTPQLMV